MVSRPPDRNSFSIADIGPRRDINLMQAASLRAKWAAITAAPMLEMQKKDTRALKVAGKLMLCA
jgi:hypothetical protein